MWESLGFRESPYNTNPLRPRADDLDLLVGREAEAVEFCTQLDTADQGILVLSGAPGVGKTSFFNIQQYRLENRITLFGPHILAARHLCPVQPDDDVRAIALRALNSLYRSVSAWCDINKKPLPTQTEKIGRWISGSRVSGVEVGVDILGCGGSFGRNVDLANVADASFETLGYAIGALAAETVESLKFKSVVIALDNMENLEDGFLKALLISFRDTLFSIPNVWWVLIGQSGLGSLIQSLDPRVFERTTGSGIEIKPIELTELDEAIAVRVSKFHKSKGGKSPLMTETHRSLFEASYGEMRFVFKYSNSICSKFVEATRAMVLSNLPATSANSTKSSKVTFERLLDEAIGKMMINRQLSHAEASGRLRQIVESELRGLNLKLKEKAVLERIGQAGHARASDFKEFGLRSSQDFSSNYLTKLYAQNLLVRQQQGRAVNYRLRGVAQLSYSFGLLKDGPEPVA